MCSFEISFWLIAGYSSRLSGRLSQPSQRILPDRLATYTPTPTHARSSKDLILEISNPFTTKPSQSNNMAEEPTNTTTTTTSATQAAKEQPATYVPAHLTRHFPALRNLFQQLTGVEIAT